MSVSLKALEKRAYKIANADDDGIFDELYFHYTRSSETHWFEPDTEPLWSEELPSPSAFAEPMRSELFPAHTPIDRVLFDSFMEEYPAGYERTLRQRRKAGLESMHDKYAIALVNILATGGNVSEPFHGVWGDFYLHCDKPMREFAEWEPRTIEDVYADIDEIRRCRPEGDCISVAMWSHTDGGKALAMQISTDQHSCTRSGFYA